MKLIALLLAIIATAPAGADQIKGNNNISLELGGSWVSGVAPGSGDNAIWNSTVTTAANCTNTLGSAVSWLGIVIANPSAPVVITGDTTLTNGANGVNLSSASVNLTINCGVITLGANQTWTVASNDTLTTGGANSLGRVQNATITLAGGGTWITSGTDDNGNLGITVNAGTVNLNKTSNSGAHAVGGPGLTVNSGGTARITGTGGDQIYDGAAVTLAPGGILDLNGNNETVAYLAGAGGIVDNTAPGKSAVLTSGSSLGNGSSTFSGTIQNSGAGATLALVKANTGTLTLNGANTYTGGTTINAGTLALTTTNNVSMAYTNTGGTLNVSAANATSSLPTTSLTLGGSNPQLTFNLGSARNSTVPVITDVGNVTVLGNVTVNVANLAQSGTYVLLQYGGPRNGPGAFVPGNLPLGATLADNTANNTVTLTYVSPLEPRVVIPTLNTNEIVVAVATPQQYGAAGDGITDDSAAFQNAINAVYNSGGAGGGVVFVPAGFYAFYTNINVPTGVTLHGDWTDWTQGTNGLVGTTFNVYFGAGQSNAAPFLQLNRSAALRDINIWYPNQNPNSIVSYPYSIGLADDCVVQNVVMVNSYQGINSYNGGAKHILSTVIGSPLYEGLYLDGIADVCHAEDVRFSPNVWAVSGLTNAPAAGGAYATWMENNGEGMRLLRVDGYMLMNIFISGYSVGIEANTGATGQPGAAFYTGTVSNCATALLAQDMPGDLGLMFANFTLDGGVAVSRSNTSDDANVMFERCTLIGRGGTAVSATGADWGSWMQFQNCAISNALDLAGPGVFNVVDSTLQGATQCVMSSSATRAAFTGCVFSPVLNIVNNGNAGNLLIDARQSISNTLFPIVCWSNIANDYASRKPATTNLYVAATFGATGDGTTDDTAAIQSALNAAGNNGGGIVYLPAGQYHLSNTLRVSGGVELRGAYETRHGTWPGNDNVPKGSILEPYGGQGTTNGPPAIALQANSGLVGVTVSYNSQNSNCIPFPPAIQGQGGNVYLIGVQCPNPYYYVDLNTYTCTNHFLDMVDGWQILTGYAVGNGSSGTIVHCHGNWTYWVDNFGPGQSQLPQSVQTPVYNFVLTNSQTYVFGNCQEVLAKDFNWGGGTFMRMVAQNGQGPNLTMIEPYCDGTSQGITLDAAAPCTITAVNAPLCVGNFGNFASLDTVSTYITSTPNFQGTARFFNTTMYPQQTYLDVNINGGDVGLEATRVNASVNGSRVSAGVLHLVNLASELANNSSPYDVLFGANAGVAGKTNEIIGCYSYADISYVNAATNSNPASVWNDYALSGYSVLNPNLPVIYNANPNSSEIFQYTNAFSFAVAAPEGVASSNIAVTLNGVAVTNLIFAGSATGWTVSYPDLAINAAYTASVTVTDSVGNVVSNTVGFDTFTPANYTFEAEDFDDNGGHFIDNPQTNAYANLGSVSGIDYTNTNPGQGSAAYRPQGLETEPAGDVPRPAYGNGLQDYDVGFNSSRNWGNYTRHYPPGTYDVYLRAANGNGSTADSASLSVVTSGQGTANQTTTKLGAFSVPGTGNWQIYTWVPLLGSNGNLVHLTTTGSEETLRVTTDNGNYNANFYELAPTTVPVIPVTLAASMNNGGITMLLQTQIGFTYQAQYTESLTATNWTSLGSPLSGNGAAQTISAAIVGNTRFYRVQIEEIQ
jgi:autotransporter-associated beta strand protein